MSAPATPHRKAILAALVARLTTIRRPTFATDAGLVVLVGEIALGEDDADCGIAVMPGETGPLGDREVWKVSETLPVQVAALARVQSWADYENAWMRVEDVLADIKQAIETADRTLGGLLPLELRRGPTVTLEREEGQQTLGVAITYEAPYATGWGIR